MTTNRQISSNPKENLKAIRILFGSLVVGIVFFAIIAVSINLVNTPAGIPGIEEVYFIAGAGIAALGCIISARLLYNRGINSIRNLTASLNEKLNHYRSLLIKCLALCDGAAIFSVIVYFLTGDFRVLIVTAVMLAVMFSFAPSKKRMITELDIDWNDQDAL
ncbi:MAG: hypothetical protein J0L56_01655 [Chitinophagales bacterium]|nr:hypothetical protein [Chitinophagales bacterium]